MPEDRTAIGVDLGEYNLYTACPVRMPDWKGSYAIPGDPLCARLDDLRERVAALLAGESDRETIVASVRQRRRALCEELDDAAREICDYARAYDRPVVVTEDGHVGPDLWAWLTDPDAHRGTAWLLPTARLRLRGVAAEYGIEVTTVPAAYSSQECHACGVIGDRPLNETFRCTNRDCHVDAVDADYNAAAVLAQRYYPVSGARTDPRSRSRRERVQHPSLTAGRHRRMRNRRRSRGDNRTGSRPAASGLAAARSPTDRQRLPVLDSLQVTAEHRLYRLANHRQLQSNPPTPTADTHSMSTNTDPSEPDASTIHALAGELESLRERIAALESELERKDDRLARLETELERVHGENERLEARVDALEDVRTPLEARLDAHEKKLDANKDRVGELQARELEKGAHLLAENVDEREVDIADGRLERVRKDDGRRYFRLPESDDPLERGGAIAVAHGDLLPIQQLARMDDDMLHAATSSLPARLAANLWKARTDPSVGDDPWENGSAGVREYVAASDMKHWIRRQETGISEDYARKLVSRTIDAVLDLSRNRLAIERKRQRKNGLEYTERRVLLMEDAVIPGDGPGATGQNGPVTGDVDG